MKNKVSILEKKVGNSSILMPEFGYKTISMVAKSLGYFYKKTSTTYFKTSGVIETKYGQPKVRKNYPNFSAKYIMDLYNNINSDTIIISPGIETPCYIGRAMNAIILPSQFIASAPNRKYVEENSNKDNIYIIGHEDDWPQLCVWIKPKNLGKLYSKLIKKAKNIIIYSGHDIKYHGTFRGWHKDNIDILDSFTGDNNYKNRIQNPKKDNYCPSHDKISHWEFSMHKEQIDNIVKYYRNDKNILTIKTSDWEGFISAKIYARLFEKNNIKPKGITYHNYWSCHPFYEAEFSRIPVQNFQYDAEKYVNEFKKFLNSLNWDKKNAEYLTWSESTIKSEKIFKSQFPTIYKTDRLYDLWCKGWNNFSDKKNSTREYIVPKLKQPFKNFNFLTLDEIISILETIPKTNINLNKK